MKFIDKSVRRNDFNQFSIRYLKNHLIGGRIVPSVADKKTFDNSHFSKANYKHGTSTKPKGWLNILLEEQNGLCCYCMRRFSGGDVSVEHIIPESFTGLNATNEYNFYSNISNDIKNYVELGSTVVTRTFANASDLDLLTKFPHLIAHSNLTAACIVSPKGTEIGCCCNNRRGNTRILPLMLMPSVDSIVKYETDGTMSILYSDDAISVQTLVALNINNETLKEVRHLWYLAKTSKIKPQGSENLPNRMRLLCGYFHKAFFAELDAKYQKYADTDMYWNLFLQYDWFWSYY